MGQFALAAERSCAAGSAFHRSYSEDLMEDLVERLEKRLRRHALTELPKENGLRPGDAERHRPGYSIPCSCSRQLDALVRISSHPMISFGVASPAAIRSTIGTSVSGSAS
jgi:hypothetical protein